MLLSRKLVSIKVIVIVFLIICCYKSALSADSLKVRRLKFIPFPNLGYSPETQWYIDAVGLVNWRIYDDTTTGNSVFKAEFNLTQNHQQIYTVEHDYYSKANKYYLTGSNAYL